MENNKNHILIVDDDNRIRDLLKEYLTENNYIVSTAENSEQAKEKLQYFMPPPESVGAPEIEKSPRPTSRQVGGRAPATLPRKWGAAC